MFFYRSHSTGQNTGHCATDFKQHQKCLLALILIQNVVFDQGEIKPSQKNVSFPIALPLVKVGRLVSLAKKKKNEHMIAYQISRLVCKI